MSDWIRENPGLFGFLALCGIAVLVTWATRDTAYSPFGFGMWVLVVAYIAIAYELAPVGRRMRESMGRAQRVTRDRRAIPRDVQRFVWQRDRGRCVQCGSNENLEFDHIIPVSKGGANTARNLQLLCEKCNRRKSDKIGG